MRGVIHRAQGVVTLTVTGVEPERLLNECASRGILFWGAEPVDPVTLRLKIHARQRRQVESIAARLMCEVRADSALGAPFFLLRLSRRYGLLAGMTVCLLSVLFLSQFILGIQVKGNVRVPTAVILSELRRQGLRIGAFGPGLDEGAIAQQALVELGELSWMAVNLNGTRANVLVRERIPRPELENAKQPADVVAEATGILLHLETWQGKPLFREGDTVVKGDVVISGWMPIDPPPYSQITDLGGRSVRAEGRVEARTWRILHAGIPIQATVKSPTGQEKNLYSLCVLGKRINFYRNSGISFAEYDKITQTYSLALPGGVILPVSLQKETVRELELLCVQVDREGSLSMLEERLRERMGLLVDDGEIVNWETSSVEENGLLKVSLLAECREEIGETVDWPS